MSTNDPAEIPFAALTRKLEQYGRVLFIHDAAIVHARINGYFDQGDLQNPNKEGTYHKLSPDMRLSLLNFALSLDPEVSMAKASSLDKQREANSLKQDSLK